MEKGIINNFLYIFEKTWKSEKKNNILHNNSNYS